MISSSEQEPLKFGLLNLICSVYFISQGTLRKKITDKIAEKLKAGLGTKPYFISECCSIHHLKIHLKSIQSDWKPTKTSFFATLETANIWRKVALFGSDPNVYFWVLVVNAAFSQEKRIKKHKINNHPEHTSHVGKHGSGSVMLWGGSSSARTLNLFRCWYDITSSYKETFKKLRKTPDGYSLFTSKSE